MGSTHDIARKLWLHSGGKAWEPRGGTPHPIITRLVTDGYLRIVDGRSGFERFKDSMVTWTDAGRAALKERSNET